uniref:Receptor kinase-like protein Xa21 n=1 Tax=Oryza barthii TaxID=65489 RepID=A0A0D3HIS9_9ORYZ
MKFIEPGKFLLVFLVCSAHVVICSSSGNETDRLSLLEFKNAITLDLQQALMSWNDSNHVCSWEGVKCRVKAPHRVISLDLRGQGLSLGLDNNFFGGHIPSSLANASKLSRIDLSRNNFTGLVPSSIGKLQELSSLNLELNQLQSSDKQGLEFMNSLSNCTKLRALSLASNQLEGEIPSSSGNLSMKLEFLYLGGNKLSGRFPAGIANLRSLSGFIPSSLSNSSQLELALLDSNQFCGRIPQGLGSLKVLQVLDVSNKNLHGRIPREIFSIPTIREIWLSSNRLDGRLPIEIGNAKQLEHLVLSSNNLSGVIPDTLGNCGSMEEIKLDQSFLSGSIPTSFGNMESLQVLNMSHNLLSGSIPKSIGSLKYLEQLDLSFNNLEGEVPEIGIFNNTTAIWIAGNKDLCGGAAKLHLPVCSYGPPSSTKHLRSIVLKVVIPLACIVSLATGISVLLFWRKKHERKSMSLPSFGRNFPKVSFDDLSRATDGFSTSNLIGRGRYSSVYKGRLLQYGDIVAVKVFSLQTRGAQKSFIAECKTLRNVRHRNLVPILTACSSIDSQGNDFKALVYQFMSQGDLHMMLYSNQDDENGSASIQIAFAQRLSIVVDVADAMEYLHHNNQGTIAHCDLKPSNILLDDSLTAHVGDFGLARFKVDCTISSSGDSIISSAINGTIGYVAPEYATGGEVSTFGDVYSFGIVLLEIFLRKRPTHDMFKDGLNIATFVDMNFPDRISEVVDQELLEY